MQCIQLRTSLQSVQCIYSENKMRQTNLGWSVAAEVRLWCHLCTWSDVAYLSFITLAEGQIRSALRLHKDVSHWLYWDLLEYTCIRWGSKMEHAWALLFIVFKGFFLCKGRTITSMLHWLLCNVVSYMGKIIKNLNIF